MKSLLSTLAHQRYVLVSLLALLVSLPLLDGVAARRLITSGILVLIVVTGPVSLSRHRIDFVVSICLALMMWAASWAAGILESAALHAASGFAASAFFGHLCLLIYWRHLFGGRAISQETLYAAVNAYLALGIMFAFLFAAIGVLSPEAFRGAAFENAVQDVMNLFVYYSFVTLTTLGYGDMSPATPVVMTLAYLEALIGQLYIAMTIARVVGIYSTQKMKRGSP